MKETRKGIILAGGKGSRLTPITRAISKQLLPVYDKPMIMYPLSVLMLAGIKDILIITSDRDRSNFKELLGNGNDFGISIKYCVQKKPIGLADAFLIGESFVKKNDVALILGDNIFHGDELIKKLRKFSLNKEGATIFAYPVSDPERYGVAELSKEGKVTKIEEKPKVPKSNYAITGLYFYDNSVIEKAKALDFSKRGELEITDINNMYLNEGKLNAEIMGRGMAWFDTGTCDSLFEATSYIRTLERRQGLKVGCPEEIAWRSGWISTTELKYLASKMIKSGYGSYLMKIIEESI